MTSSTGSIRARIRETTERHEVLIDLVMGLLAVVYVLLWMGLARGLLPASLSAVVPLISVVFILEFGVRCWAAASRWGYVLGHIPDLLALIPAARWFRLFRLLRLARFAPGLYGSLGLDVPVVRRTAWHVRRVRASINDHAFLTLVAIVAIFVLLGSIVVTVIEKDGSGQAFGDTLYWAINSTLGSGDPGYVTTPEGWFVSWSLILLSMTILAVVTGAIVSFLVNVALKEGRGMGASGYREHVVVCGWNASVGEFIAELGSDRVARQVVLLCDADANPYGDGVYFVKGDPTTDADLERAGVPAASVAVVVPSDASDESDMRSILAVLAIKALAPHVRVTAFANKARHVDHLRRAEADEVIVPSQIAARLAARSTLYAGLTPLVTDLISGGAGWELYRVRLPEDYAGLTVEQGADRLRREHRATLIGLVGAGQARFNPPADQPIVANDDCLIVAESIGTLVPAGT